MRQTASILVVLSLLLTTTMAAAATRPRAETLTGPVSGQVMSVIDGDTLAVNVHVWIGQQLITDVRIRGIDTPEMRSSCAAERRLAENAKHEISQLIGSAPVVLSDIRLEKYAGRVLATVHTQTGVSLAEHLIAQGMARPYGGKKRLDWCDAKGRLMAAAVISSGQE